MKKSVSNCVELSLINNLTSINDNNTYELSIADSENLKDITKLLLLIENNCLILKEDVKTKAEISKFLYKQQKELGDIIREE